MRQNILLLLIIINLQDLKRKWNKSEVFNLANNSDLNTKLATLASKTESKVEKNKIVKFQAVDSSGIKDDGTQNYCALASLYFKKIANSYYISAWKGIVWWKY